MVMFLLHYKVKMFMEINLFYLLLKNGAKFCLTDNINHIKRNKVIYVRKFIFLFNQP